MDQLTKGVAKVLEEGGHGGFIIFPLIAKKAGEKSRASYYSHPLPKEGKGWGTHICK